MEQIKRIFTKGNVEVQDIEIGDIHYEFGYGHCIKTEVISLPEETDQGYWEWQSKSLSNGRIINYGVDEKHSH